MNGSGVFSNLIWRFAERIGAKLISVVVNLLLARLLAPELYGTVAIVTLITDILQVFIESGFGTALIQKKDADELDFSSVFFFNITVGVVLYLLLFFAAPFIAQLYRRSDLTQFIRVVGIILIISGLRNIQQAYISRNMLFRCFFFSTLGGTVVAAFAGIFMAYKGYGVWAYVTQYLLNNFVGTAILWFTVKWRPKMQFSFQRLKGLFSYAWKLLASSILNTITEKIRPLIIGYRFTGSDLAFYNEGILFPNLIVENVNTSIDSVLLPALSQEQDRIENVKQMTHRAVQLGSYIMWPLMMGLFACARPLVSFALGEKWLPCIPFIRIFCVYYALYPIHTANLNAIKAVGRSDIFLRLEVIKKIEEFAIIIFTVFIGVKAMAYGVLVEGFVSLLINCWPGKKLYRYTIPEQIRDVIPSVLISVIMCVVVSLIPLLGASDLITLVLQVITGAMIYIGISYFSGLEVFQYLLSTIKALLKKRSQQE